MGYRAVDCKTRSRQGLVCKLSENGAFEFLDPTRSITNIYAGSCVIMRSTQAFSATACGVTPEPQKSDISCASMDTGAP